METSRAPIYRSDEPTISSAFASFVPAGHDATLERQALSHCYRGEYDLLSDRAATGLNTEQAQPTDIDFAKDRHSQLRDHCSKIPISSRMRRPLWRVEAIECMTKRPMASGLNSSAMRC